MTIETLKSPNLRNRNSISVMKSKFLSVSSMTSMNTLLAILKVTDTRRDVILAGGPQISLETPPPLPPLTHTHTPWQAHILYHSRIEIPALMGNFELKTLSRGEKL